MSWLLLASARSLGEVCGFGRIWQIAPKPRVTGALVVQDCSRRCSVREDLWLASARFVEERCGLGRRWQIAACEEIVAFGGLFIAAAGAVDTVVVLVWREMAGAQLTVHVVVSVWALRII